LGSARFSTRDLAEAILGIPRPFRQKEVVLSGKTPLVSSAVALSTRATVAPAPLPAKNFVRLVLLGGATLALIGALHQIQVSPVPVSAPAVAMAHLLDDAGKVPAKPSAFAEEQAMSPAQLLARWEPLIQEASKKFHVPAQWIRAVMRQESGGRTMLAESRPIVSDAGAMGVMQVMPGTYREMAEQYRLGADAFDPHDNIFAGTAYLSWLKSKYGYPAMFAAYNDGPGNIEDHLHRGRPLPKETRGYIASIAKSLNDKSVSASLTRVALTQPDGSKFAIDAHQVKAIRAAVPGLYADTVKSVITIGNLSRGVREDVAEATELLRGHGAKI
jgi:soluble lytic murein transglycosylase-like protein